ncbi:MAG: 16S rRNA (cytidine(1402)-2'-O)-methyltransferase [Clostridia bacterium]|nr:16S rRNA (cytidine(1402)-2'-O)-methyltransferase [Clostridia bacterium]
MAGTLFLCPTPIGNLQDMTFRVLDVLKEVDYIAAEDTRRTKQLLNYFEIDQRLFSYHEHNKEKSGQKVLQLLHEGHSVAIVTDAGMPGISDPGESIVQSCIEEAIDVVCLPGPSAFVNALVISGFSTTTFCFEGFVDRNKKKRREHLESIKHLPKTLIFYEAPHRLKEFLSDLHLVLGNRRLSISRELTKKYEETFRGTVEEGLAYFTDKEPKGEFVIVVEGGSGVEVQDFFEDMSIEEHLMHYMVQGMTKKDAIKQVTEDRKIKKSDVYKVSLEL